MGRVAFVTGATGFVGTHLVEALVSAGWRVRALVRPTSDTRGLRGSGVELYEGDLAAPGRFAGAPEGCEVVFHLAAVTAARSEEEYARANAEWTRAIVEALHRCQPAPRRLVYLSSYAACGPASVDRARSPDATPAPLTAYGRTKLAGEIIAREAERDGVQVVIVRAPAVYGPGDRGLLPYFRCARWGLAPIPGGGRGRLQLVFAPDLARALVASAGAPPGTYAVADPAVYGWEDIIGAIGAVTGRRPLRLAVPPALVRRAAGLTEALGRLGGRAVAFNREKAEELLATDWVCDLAGSEKLLRPDQFTPLEAGVDRTVRWYLRQGWL